MRVFESDSLKINSFLSTALAIMSLPRIEGIVVQDDDSQCRMRGYLIGNLHGTKGVDRCTRHFEHLHPITCGIQRLCKSSGIDVDILNLDNAASREVENSRRVVKNIVVRAGLVTGRTTRCRDEQQRC